MVDPDLVLLDRWRARDKASGKQLFKRHFAIVYRLLRHKAGAEADELTQRTFLACQSARSASRRSRCLAARTSARAFAW
jgi:DNA-directed RNA polymerase specialized sigma24 family protein